MAGGDRLVLTGRLSPATHPWLADHAVGGTALLPGTGFVELAVQAGDRVGCDVLEELTLQAPLWLDATGGVELQIVVEERRPTAAAHSPSTPAPPARASKPRTAGRSTPRACCARAGPRPGTGARRGRRAAHG
ncbi:hypothetical protein GCM10020000_53040 [Streptomyces olivoverticillatus]